MEENPEEYQRLREEAVGSPRLPVLELSSLSLLAMVVVGGRSRSGEKVEASSKRKAARAKNTILFISASRSL